MPSILSCAFSGCLCLLLLSGCSEPPPDLKELEDQRIEDDLLENLQQTDAIEFFKKGGQFANTGEDDVQADYDQQHVAPLLERMSEEFGFKWLAMTDPAHPKEAIELIAKIPAGTNRVEVYEFLVKEQQGFPGDILQGWGNDWFSLDILLPSEVEALEKMEAQMQE